jgi:hypothetical protein
VQSFYGAMGSHAATKGVFLTTSTFSREATDCAAEDKDKKIVLIDGNRLTRLMIDAGVGVSVRETYRVHQGSPGITAGMPEQEDGVHCLPHDIHTVRHHLSRPHLGGAPGAAGLVV